MGKGNVMKIVIVIISIHIRFVSLGSFIRAWTLSLGSIAFGSLIVAILETIRWILNAASQASKNRYSVH